MIETPVLLIIYNRPDLTKKVIEPIRQVKPSKLFIAADGPRVNKTGEENLCNETRELVLSLIDWPCEIKTFFRDKNLGCRKAVTSAIDWFFSEVEEGIILEDDVLAEKSFFEFCSQLLERYKDDKKIFHISGNNFQLSSMGKGSYYLSKIPHIWGWATWKRAWREYDVNISSFNSSDKIAYFNDAEINCFWNKNFKGVQNISVDNWDYQWVYCLFSKKAYAIQPQYNLTKNIGFDKRALRTTSAEDYLADLKIFQLETIIHPDELVYNETADINFQKFFDWYIPLYENRISGTDAVKLLRNIITKRVFNIYKQI